MLEKKIIKESVLSLTPYLNGSHSEELIRQHKKILKLDSNEATISPSPRVTAALIQYIQDGPINWYPDIESKNLCKALSQYTGLPMSHILTFNGSDHALETIARACLNKNDEVIFFNPTYDHFRVYVESCDAKVTTILENREDTLSKKLFQSVNSQTKIVYLVNPNNPTGHETPLSEIEDALKNYPHLLFLVDEAYYEFSELTATSLLQNHHNLIVTRSFSKAFGLAGLRCGYLLAKSDLCAQISKIRVGKNINALAQVAAKAALEDLEHMRRYVDEVKQAKSWFIHMLNKKGLVFRDTNLNFLLLKVQQPKKIVSYLKNKNIYIRDRSYLPGMKGFLRITIGDRLVMKRFWKIFEKLPQEWLTCNELLKETKA